MDKEPPRKTIYRLSIYQRCLQRLQDKKIETVSSEALAKAAGVKSTQLRKDLAYFGQLGTRGLGYKVETLWSVLDEVLGRARLQPVILVGVGNLGAALLRYSGFQKEGFEIAAAFDMEPQNAKKLRTPQKVFPMEEAPQFIREQSVKMAILAVPATAAQVVTNQLIDCGIQGLLNFSPSVLEVPSHITVNNVDLALELENLSYFIK